MIYGLAFSRLIPQPACVRWQKGDTLVLPSSSELESFFVNPELGCSKAWLHQFHAWQHRQFASSHSEADALELASWRDGASTAIPMPDLSPREYGCGVSRFGCAASRTDSERDSRRGWPEITRRICGRPGLSIAVKCGRTPAWQKDSCTRHAPGRRRYRPQCPPCSSRSHLYEMCCGVRPRGQCVAATPRAPESLMLLSSQKEANSRDVCEFLGAETFSWPSCKLRCQSCGT